jgi:hypothetical protein
MRRRRPCTERYQTQMEEEASVASRYSNGSVSWTEQAGASTRIDFAGSAVYAYGLSGGEAG